MKVRAIRKGYFGLQLREVGDEFDVTDPKAFSAKWMEKVGSTPVVSKTEPDKKDKKPTARVSDVSKI